MRVRLTGIAVALLVAIVGALTLTGTALAAPTGAACPLPQFPDKDGVIFVVGLLCDTGKTPPEPVAGVKITVEDDQGNPLGETLSKEDGSFAIRLPGTSLDVLDSTIVVKIDESTLPSGTELTNPKQVENTRHIQIEQNIAFQFPIGPKIGEDPWYQQAVQLAVGGIVFSSILALASLGLSMVFGTTGLTNFAHGELISFGALVAYGFDSGWGIPLILAGILATIVSGGFGYAQDQLLWRPLRKRGTGLIAMMIVSIGLSIFLRNVYQYVAGADNHNYTQYATVEPWHVGWVDITPKDILVTLVAVIALLFVTQALQRTKMGKATRAVADSPALAASSGINVDRVISVVWIGGAALAGLAGVMLGMTQGFDYQVGFKILLLVFAAVTLGGLGTIWGAILGSYVIGTLIEVSTLIVPAELKFVGALGVLIVVLLFRPQGLLGRPERVG
ncbi:MAG TPA: branched-chain amino acid ABC transporter permease [Nocardioidaceae bacterium]|nr:branched-chain amino acid ABC transporter permease [Nocardioidaceae bacterium]